MKNFSHHATFRLNPRAKAWAGLMLVAALGAGQAVQAESGSPGPASTPSKPAKPAGPPVQVSTTRVVQEAVPIVQSGTGNVVALATVTVKARVDGQLESVQFTEGQDVKAGQSLARIDSRVYEAQLNQALAQKAKDQASLGNAEMDLRRYTELIKDDATTQQTLDTQGALVKQLQAALLTDEAQISLARVQLDYTRITAPISGRIGARLIDPGNIVHAADVGGLVVINQIDPIGLQFTLPETAFQALNQAMRNSRKPLKVQALDRVSQQVLAEGELALLNNQIDPGSGTITLKARFANGSHKLWPGQSLNARITLGESSASLTVPNAAIQRSQNGLFVYVVGADDIAHLQPVVAGQSDRQKTVIETGLSAGDRVVVDGQYRLTPGARVVEAKAAAPAQAANASGAKP
ncbi:efflux RND transporter periplasmic adaptor subunit [Curvibacter gracilis]|uniref:efflux RND transporter periplasmic adaptor subunit n=1 Tax=Curvibacter gracilis TaxID=230310 RepID=UPI0004AD2E9B|nr:efflux RND transporter periplasmic adaptor subunit [Curvibacter gracilis]